MNFLIISISLLFFWANNSPHENPPTDDILKLYQPVERLQLQKQELAYWEAKTQAAPRQYVFQQQLANANSGMFGLTADIRYLKTAEELLKGLIQKELPNKAGILRSLAHNYISQHRFCDALELVNDAAAIGSDFRSSQLMLFDVYQELGDENIQIELLNALSEQRDFNYLIRLAKWEDGQGRLDQTIAIMLKAEAIAKSSKQQELIGWMYSNLGDYYGHAGEIERSQAYFQKSLELNPADWYSMKGLAWIAYSHENNIEKALNLLNLVKAYSSDPSILLLEAEILQYKGETTEANEIRKTVTSKVSKPEYGNMYNHFLAEYYADFPEYASRAIRLAEQEIRERPIPQSYDLLAMVYFKQGAVEKARTISKNHILGKTYEPKTLINQVYYFKGQSNSAVEQIKIELKDARFELGPLSYEEFLAV